MDRGHRGMLTSTIDPADQRLLTALAVSLPLTAVMFTFTLTAIGHHLGSAVPDPLISADTRKPSSGIFSPLI